jgi:hypothetical protein
VKLLKKRKGAWRLPMREKVKSQKRKKTNKKRNTPPFDPCPYVKGSNPRGLRSKMFCMKNAREIGPRPSKFSFSNNYE